MKDNIKEAIDILEEQCSNSANEFANVIIAQKNSNMPFAGGFFTTMDDIGKVTKQFRTAIDILKAELGGDSDEAQTVRKVRKKVQ